MTTQAAYREALAAALPEGKASLAGRVWRPELGGPSVVVVRDGELVDVSAEFPTMRDLCESDDPAGAITNSGGETVGSVVDILGNTDPLQRDTKLPWLLAPIDLQVTKAAGVTFTASLVERVIEEKAGGDPDLAASVRAEALGAIGADLTTVVPGSEAAQRLKDVLKPRGWWSQYLEVGLGPDAEIFTKAPTLSVVGTGMDVGVLSTSAWNNPEPEVVLIVSSKGEIRGATLGNDVNLRDYEGRSALLLGKAKDNNASAAMGPFVRFFDAGFGIPDVERADVALSIQGEDGFSLNDVSSMRMIRRSPVELVRQLMGAHHQYPDGAALYTGTMFAPTQDRGEAGRGFTHHVGDVVAVSTPVLGALVNRVRHCDSCAPWVFGQAALMRNLATRGLI